MDARVIIDATPDLDRALDALRRGEPVTVARHGKPVADIRGEVVEHPDGATLPARPASAKQALEALMAVGRDLQLEPFELTQEFIDDFRHRPGF